MSEYVIITDSTTDLTEEMVKEADVFVIPMEFTISGRSYMNDPLNEEMSSEKFYDLVRHGENAITSQITVSRYESIITPFLEEGKDVLILSFSSALSGTYQSSVIAADELKEKYPARQIISVDSRCASMGEGLLVWYAAQKRLQGMPIEELADWVKNNRLNLCHWFTVDDLNHLKRGGRVSGAAAFFGTLVGIKPILHVDDEGRLIPVAKVRGRRQSLCALLDRMEQTKTDDPEQTVFISHGDSKEDAMFVADEVKKRFGIKNIRISTIGPVIGAHSGPGTIALFFMGSKR